MRRAGCDVGHDFGGSSYLTGIESISPHRLWAVAVPRNGKPMLFCQDYEGHNALLSSEVRADFTHPGAGDPASSLARMLKQCGFGNTTIEMELGHCWPPLPVRGFLRLKKALPEAT
jgi:hypothetical protein